MVVIVTRDVADRFRGFLASVLLEIAPGVYTAPNMTAGVRDRVWRVLEEWFSGLGGGSIVMTWKDSSRLSGQGLLTLGLPTRDFAFLDELITTRVEHGEGHRQMLQAFERLGIKASSSEDKNDGLK